MVSGTTQKTEAFEARKNWVLGCGGIVLITITCQLINYIT